MSIGIIITSFKDRIPFALKNIEIIKERNKELEYKIILINNGLCKPKNFNIPDNIDIFIQNKENPGLQRGDWVATLEGLEVAKIIGCDFIVRMGYRDYVLYDNWIIECKQLIDINKKKAMLSLVNNTEMVEGCLMVGYLDFIISIMPVNPPRKWERSFTKKIHRMNAMKDILFDLDKFYCFDHNNEDIVSIQEKVRNDSNYW